MFGVPLWAATRRVMMNFVPFPNVLSAVMVPWCSSTICFVMARPNPVPPILRDRALSTR